MAFAKSTILLKNHDKIHEFQNLFLKQAAGAFLSLSMGIGLVAFFLPIAVVLAAGYHGNFSISWFYHASDVSRNLFVGGLCATGVFLILFRGLSQAENWLLNAAGGFGILVAFNPMSAIQCPQTDSGISIHGICAGLFFLCLAIVAIGYSKSRVQDIAHDKIRWRFKFAYNFAGMLMVAMPASVALIHVIYKESCESHWIYWIETFGIWSFAMYWFTKTAEYRFLLGARW